jgi:hypothetical protein
MPGCIHTYIHTYDPESLLNRKSTLKFERLGRHCGNLKLLSPNEDLLSAPTKVHKFQLRFYFVLTYVTRTTPTIQQFWPRMH